VNPDLIQRALVTRIEHLEAEVSDAKRAAEFNDSEFLAVARVVFPEAAERVCAHEVIEELKRRGLTSGKAGE